MGLERIKELNIKEIAYLSNKFGIIFANGSFKIKKDFSGQDIYEAINYLKAEIWNEKNIKDAISAMESQRDEEILYYWPPEENEPIDNFLERAGILDFRIAITDPMSWLCGINPTWDGSPENDPASYIRYLFENALFLVSLSKWVETGQLIMLPHMGLWDYNAFFELGKMNEAVHKNNNLDDTDLGKELYKMGSFEAGVSALTEMMRQMQENETAENIKKAISVDDETAASLLSYMKKLPKEKRDIEAILQVAKMYDIEDELVKARIERFKKQSLFHIENYFDISEIHSCISIRHSMPMAQALYIGDKLNVIPISDYRLNKLTFDLYEQILSLSEEYKNNKELVESKIEFNAPFFSGLSPEFIAKQKKLGKSKELRIFLNKKWKDIREMKNPVEYMIALKEFSDEINTEFSNLQGNLDQIKKEALGDSMQVLSKTVGEFVGGIENGMWLAITKSIPTLFSGGIGAYKSYDSKKYELKRNPLFIFLDKK